MCDLLVRVPRIQAGVLWPFLTDDANQRYGNSAMESGTNVAEWWQSGPITFYVTASLKLLTLDD